MSTSTALFGAGVQSTQVHIEFTGQRTLVPCNLVSRSLYKYDCIRKTSLGPLILGAAISTQVQNSIKWVERFDYCMHYIGCPAIIILLICSHSTTAWIVASTLFCLHLLTLLWTFTFFVVPLDRAKNMGLAVPTKSKDSINNLMNDFITITASQTSAYALTDFQAAIFAQASVGVEIKMMVYNNWWSVWYNHLAGHGNVFIHILPFLLMTTSTSSSVLISTAIFSYLVWYILWRALLYTTSEPLCWDWLCFCLCLFTICAPSQKTILDRVQTGKAQPAIPLTYISGNSFTERV